VLELELVFDNHIDLGHFQASCTCMALFPTSVNYPAFGQSIFGHKIYSCSYIEEQICIGLEGEDAFDKAAEHDIFNFSALYSISG
jgi:hypothetical protein